MISRLVTAPAAEPVTTAEAKTHLRLEHALDDTYVGTLITAARQWAERHCWCGFVTQTWEVVLSEFPCEDEIELPRGALASITSISYVDADGETQTLSTDVYEADTKSTPGMVRLKYDQSWPYTRDHWSAVTITYVVGTAAGSVPGPVKHALLLLISQFYENRTADLVGGPAVEALLEPYRLVRF